MSDTPQSSGDLSGDASGYVQLFIDETEEQLEDLVETILTLEQNPESAEELNEAFRLVHSIKGSAGMLGLDSITALTHHLENHFEWFRSGVRALDQPMANLALRCVDFLRGCTQRLRQGQSLGSATELIEELREREELESSAGEASPEQESDSALEREEAASEPVPSVPEEPSVQELPDSGALLTLRIEFEPGLQLADLKAQLIVSRLACLGEIQSTTPGMEELEQVEELSAFEVILDSSVPEEEIRAAADVDGAQTISLASGTGFPEDSMEKSSAGSINEEQTTTEDEEAQPEEDLTLDEVEESDRECDVSDVSGPTTEEAPDNPDKAEATPAAEATPVLETIEDAPTGSLNGDPVASPARADTEAEIVSPEMGTMVEKTKTRVVETLRVDIDRLDNLMNLAGELVINRARFVQVSRQLSPQMKKGSSVNRLRDFGDSLRQIIDGLQQLQGEDNDWLNRISELQTGLELVQEQAVLLENSCGYFSQMTEAIDQLTRVSDKLQRGVLETRMVPVGPLFNRFKRVVRDLAVERDKQVNLQLKGEKTELDKRMIDEMGDPLIHLVRNSIDHGLEPTQVRRARGKPEVGTILLEASQSGHSVNIRVQDDGGGMDVEKIRAKVIEKGLLSFVAAEELSDAELIEYIWHPGFSTAAAITDVSGRGVGMDVVKTRIHELNGTIDIQSVPHQGTSFIIRLPLTLAIINSLLVRARNVIFSIPISDVREIVSIPCEEVISVNGRETFDVRGEFVPLVDIEDVFEWPEAPHGNGNRSENSLLGETSFGGVVQVVIIQATGRIMGLRVQDLLGGQEVVIKSLSDNFLSIRGLSGASILGDGTVCLMLDAAAVIDLASQPSGKQVHRKEASVGSMG